MAVWETTERSAAYLLGARFSGGDTTITKVDDNEDDNTFEVGDTVTVTFDGGTTATHTFRGTITIQGEVYPVLENTSGAHYVIGTVSSALPQQISSSINAETFTVCFLPGTLVATPSGERKVEDILAGDMVLTFDGRAVPAKWIGRQTVSTHFGPAERLMPIRFAAGSLGGGGGQAPCAA